MALHIFKRNQIFSDNAEDAFPRRKLISYSEKKNALNEVKNIIHDRHLTPFHQFSAKQQIKPIDAECTPLATAQKLEKPKPKPVQQKLADTKNPNYKIDEGFFDYCTPYNGKSEVEIWRELNAIDDSLLDMVLRCKNSDHDDDDELPMEKDSFYDIENDCSFLSGLNRNDSGLQNDCIEFEIEQPPFPCQLDSFME